MAALRSGGPLGPQRLVEEAEHEPLDEAQQELVQQMAERWVIGDPPTAAAQVRELAATYAVDEVMIHPVAGAFRGTSPGTSPYREQTLQLLSGALAEPAGAD